MLVDAAPRRDHPDAAATATSSACSASSRWRWPSTSSTSWATTARVFERIRDEYAASAAGAGLHEPDQAIPVSALRGDNVTTAAEREHGVVRRPDADGLAARRAARAAARRRPPFRCPVQWVNRPTPNFRGVCGQVVERHVARRRRDRRAALGRPQPRQPDRHLRRRSRRRGARAGRHARLRGRHRRQPRRRGLRRRRAPPTCATSSRRGWCGWTSASSSRGAPTCSGSARAARRRGSPSSRSRSTSTPASSARRARCASTRSATSRWRWTGRSPSTPTSPTATRAAAS